jgi:hypothetical protein
MTSSGEYRRIAALVNDWADKMEDSSTSYGEIVDEMRAFSKGIVAVINIFASVMDATTPEETERAALALVNKGDRIITIALREPLKIPAVAPFAMNTVSVRPGTDVAMHIDLPRDFGPTLEITVRLQP